MSVFPPQRAAQVPDGSSRWLRTLDVVVAAGVFLYNLPIQRAYVPHDAPEVLGVVLSLALCAPFPASRRRPRLAFALMVAAASVQVLAGMPPIPADVILLAGLYAVASRCSRATSLAAAGVLGVLVVVGALRFGAAPVPTVTAAAVASVLIASVWMWGFTIGLRRAYVAGLAERAEQAERSRDDQARIAAVEERARIAREIHDIVSHSLSVVVVMSEGAAGLVHTDPHRSEQAMREVTRTGRTALAEMRRMLGVLREEEAGSHAPQPGTAELPALVEQVRRAGTAVHLHVGGQVRPLGAGTELVVYRIVQEALTNVRKHAGPDAGDVEVRVDYHPDRIEVLVRDEGRGRGAAAPGHGLTGMRERVQTYGGRLRAGPRADGAGFEVAATLPSASREPVTSAGGSSR
ncbi:sensor histidine kinase [Kineococcus sp. SYSU DK001]|uniref:sensor histidine kinase n=1 Tax=Kineococcus sp. SYSU DK001 TaxID=3383122 RepID=UPI003D7DF707